MSEWILYLQLGLHHIADLAGYDHILFITALAIPYTPRDWRRLGVLVTAFTLGHSLTLALATLRVVSVPSEVVELLIPLTIFVTAVLSWREASADAPAQRVQPSRYALAAGFGLIHGLGFSNYLRALLGQQESITLPLFAFNVGLELGQLLILSIVLAVGAMGMRTVMGRQTWMKLMAGGSGLLAVAMLAQRIALG